MNEPTKPTRKFPTGASLGRKQEILTAEQHWQAVFQLLVTGETDAAYQGAKGNDSPPAEEYAIVTCPECEQEVFEDETDDDGICDACGENINEEDYDDGQPSELQEWHDFDPYC